MEQVAEALETRVRALLSGLEEDATTAERAPKRSRKCKALGSAGRLI